MKKYETKFEERIVGTIYDKKFGLEGKFLAHLLKYRYLEEREG